MKKLRKNKYSIVYGKKEDGLFHFIEHYANSESLKQKKIYIEEYNEQ
jgi:hypothetical protein